VTGRVQLGLRENLAQFSLLVGVNALVGGMVGTERVVVPLLADDPRPRYLMGLGSPLDMLDAVHRGVDLFDSVLPARVARNGTVWVPEGRLNLRNAIHLDDSRPVQEGCRCRLCRTFSRAYLAHLFRADELLAYRLATCHNLTFTLDFMAGIRRAIASGTLPDLIRDTAVRRAPAEPADPLPSDTQAGAKEG
jgi:queuine tRNA-ribosyltransferase